MTEEPIWPPQDFSDDALATDVALHLAGAFLYHVRQRSWYCADPPGWTRDDTLLTINAVRFRLRKIAAHAPVGKRAKILSAQTIYRVEKLLRSEQEMVADPLEWRVTATGLAPQ